MPASEGGNAPQAQPPERRGDDSAGPALLQCQGGTRFQCVEDDACELAFEAAECFASALPLALLALEVSASGWVDARLRDSDSVQGAVELAVAAAVEPVAPVLAGAGFERGDAGVAGKP